MQCKKEFPFFKLNPELIYLDSAATAQKPQVVVDTLTTFYTQQNANLHRGIYRLAEEATELYEEARATVARFLQARSSSEIIFTHGATEASNALVYGWGEHAIKEGDEIVVTVLEHHAQFVPWQQLALRKKAFFKIIPVTDEGYLNLSSLETIITEKTKVVAVTQVSNAIGTHVDLGPIIQRARAVGAVVVIDGSQAVPYQPVNLQKIDADFYFFSGHKAFGPMGVGVLYARKELHEKFYPMMTGGGMVHEVTAEKTVFAKPPRCYEAGTPPAAEAIALGTAIRYLESLSPEKVAAHVAALTARTIEGLSAFQNVRLLGPLEQLKQSGHLISFVVDKMHAHDVAAALDQYGICVRAGHHCAQPLAQRLRYSASVRASFHAYSTFDDVEQFLNAMAKVVS